MSRQEDFNLETPQRIQNCTEASEKVQGTKEKQENDECRAEPVS